MLTTDLSLMLGIGSSDPNYGRLKLVVDEPNAGARFVLDDQTTIATVVGIRFEMNTYTAYISGAVANDAALTEATNIMLSWNGGIRLVLEPFDS